MQTRNLSWIYSTGLPILTGIVGTAILFAYIAPWTVIHFDAAGYLRMAEEIQKGHWYMEHWERGVWSYAPVYPLLVALVEWVVPDFEIAGTWVAVLSAAAVVIPLFFLARQFYGERVAWLSIPLHLLNIWYLEFIPLPLTESLFTLLFLAGIVTVYNAAEKKSPGWWFAAGIVSGATWLTRDVGLIVPFLSFLWFAITLWKKRSVDSIMINSGIALVLGILLICIPLKVVIALDHKGVPNSSFASRMAANLAQSDLRDILQREAFVAGLTKDGTEYVMVEAQGSSLVIADLLKHWDLLARRFGYNLGEFPRTIWRVFGALPLMLIFLGIFRGKDISRKSSKEHRNALLFVGSFVLLYLVFYLSAGAFTNTFGRGERYLVPLIPLSGIWVAAGMLYVSSSVQRFEIKHLGKGVLLTGMMAITIMGLHDIKRLDRSREIAKVGFYKKLGMKLIELKSPMGLDHLVIMSDAPYIPYYSGGDWVLTPYANYPEVIKFARSRNVNLFFLDKELFFLRPQLSFLRDPDLSLPELERVLHLSYRKDPKRLYAVLYQIKNEKAGNPPLP